MISMVPPSLGPLHVCVELPGKEILVWYPNTLTVKEKKESHMNVNQQQQCPLPCLQAMQRKCHVCDFHMNTHEELGKPFPFGGLAQL